MDSIDRTYLKLKRPDFLTLFGILSESSEIYEDFLITVNPLTFKIEILDSYHDLIKSYGWKIEEFNEYIDAEFNILSYKQGKL